MPINENKIELMSIIISQIGELRKNLITLQRGDDGELPENVDKDIFDLRYHLARVESVLDNIKTNYNVEKRIY